MATITSDVRPRPTTRNTWETVSWLFMRISALALVILAVGHVLIQHVVNSVYTLAENVVLQRWASLGWRVFDLLLLGFALIHGLNGLRYVVDDYILNPGLNRIIKYLIFVVGLILIVVGSIAIIGVGLR